MELSTASSNAPRNRRAGGGGGGTSTTAHSSTNSHHNVGYIVRPSPSSNGSCGATTGNVGSINNSSSSHNSNNISTSIITNNHQHQSVSANRNKMNKPQLSRLSQYLKTLKLSKSMSIYWKNIRKVVYVVVIVIIVGATFQFFVVVMNPTKNKTSQFSSRTENPIQQQSLVPKRNPERIIDGNEKVQRIKKNTPENIHIADQNNENLNSKENNHEISKNVAKQRITPSTKHSASYWEEVIPTDDVSTPYYIIHDWKKHIEKTQEYQRKHGIESIQKYITAYIEPWYMFNDTIPGTGSRGDMKNEKDPGVPPQFVIPLPLRTHTPEDLRKYIYKHSATSCADVPGKLPIDRGLEIDPISGEPIVWNVGDEPTPPNFPWEEANFCPSEADPFLPWIHDLFPEVPNDNDSTNQHKSTKVQFIAQNKRKCRTGTKFTENVNRLVPQVTLFQSISVQRISEQTAQQLAPSLWKPSDSTNEEEKRTQQHSVRYRLAPYEDSDHDGMYTRFICQFRTTIYDINDDSTPVLHDVLIGETLSVYPFNYEMVSYRKNQKALLSPKGKDSILFWTSNLHFDCPIPEQLQDVIGSGISIISENDIPTIHLDLIPIRTSVRYEELYLTEDLVGQVNDWGLPAFDAKTRWGNNNVLPRIEASGRWSNLPICSPPQEPPRKESTQGDGGKESTTKRLLRTERQQNQPKEDEIDTDGVARQQDSVSSKRHYLSACLWASSAFKTRGMKRGSDTRTNDRLLEWIEFHLLAGFDHIYLYDNSGAHTNETTLQPIVDMFHPSEVTRIDWPSIICNNNVPAHDSPGERSTQYAAENSCRTRHAPYTEWIAAFDTDEYFVPMGNYTSLKAYLRDAASGGTNIVSLRSSRGRLRRDKSTLVTLNADEISKRDGFEKLPESLYLDAYNCDSAGSPKPSWGDRARKQIYRADYVLYHFVHYSTVTLGYLHTYKNATDAGMEWKRRYGESPPSERVADELNEAVMVHTKTLTGDSLTGWQKKCRYDYPKKWQGCWAAFPWPINSTLDGNLKNKKTIIPYDDNGYEYNCYINPTVEYYWIPKLQQSIQARKNRLPLSS